MMMMFTNYYSTTISSSLLCLLFFLVSSSSLAQYLPLTDYTEYFGGEDNEAYLAWVSNTLSDGEYEAAAYLPSSAVDSSSEGVAVHWSIDRDNGNLELALAARASGWVGFGMSDNGGMRGSDIVLFEADKPDRVRDTFVLDDRTIPTDDCSQDWELVESSVDTNFLLLRLQRKLQTGDPQDIPIFDTGPESPFQRVIAAWGDGQLGFHGRDKVARGGVNWFHFETDAESAFQNEMAAQESGNFFTGATNYPIKPIETEYPYFCVTGAQLREKVGSENLDIGLSIIGYEPVVERTAHVHHFTVYASADENDDTPCEQDAWYQNTTNVPEMVYVWTPGEPSFALPPSLGAPLGGADGFRSFIVEIHYDNPDEIHNLTDSSGVRFHYGDTRPIEMGVLQLGDPFIGLYSQQIGVGISQHMFDCGGGCSTAALSEPVTVLREYLHMHEAGTYASNQQIRNGKVIRSSEAQFFDFDQQGNHAVVQKAFEVQPGDAFKMTCKYRDASGKVFGLASRDEMCISFVFYYPRQKLGGVLPWMCGYRLDQIAGYPAACSSPQSSDIVSDDSAVALPRAFGTDTKCSVNSVDEPAVGSSSAAGAAQGAQAVSSGVALVLILASVLL